MSILDTVGDKLVSDAVVDGSSGWTLCKSYMPDNLDNATDQVVAVFETGGAFPTPGLEYPDLQIIVRGLAYEYDLVRTKVDDVVASIDDATLSGFIFVYLSNSPIPLGYDANNRPSVSLNFNAAVTR